MDVELGAHKSSMPSARDRILSIQYMRGIAALLVVYAHIVVVGITDRVTPHTYLPGDPGVPAQWPLARWGSTLQAYLEPEYIIERFGVISGELGVMLFFLISGYVIQRSLETGDILTFLWRRAFRVYPLCILAVLVAAFLGTAYARLQGAIPPYTVWNTLGSATLLGGWNVSFYTIPLLWSLGVELCFYVLMATTRRVLGKPLGLGAIAALGAACLLSVWIERLQPAWLAFAIWQIRVLGYNAAFITFLLVGAAICRGRGSSGRDRLRCFVAVAFLLLCYVMAIRIFDEPIPLYIDPKPQSALAALAIFSSLLLLEPRLREWRIPSFFGEISYPLYLCHIPLGWGLVFELSRRGFSPTLVFSLTIGVCLLLAWLLHITVEMPIYNWARRRKPGLKLRPRWHSPLGGHFDAPP